MLFLSALFLKTLLLDTNWIKMDFFLGGGGVQLYVP
jgi:hypothetical protein